MREARATEAAPKDGTDLASKTAAALDLVASYVPTEALGLYVAAIGILHPESLEARWDLFYLGCGLILLFVTLGYLEGKRAAGGQALDQEKQIASGAKWRAVAS